MPDGVNPATSPGDVRLLRRVRAAAASRPPSNPRFTPEESTIINRIDAGHPWPEGPVAMLPVLQLNIRDIPLLRPPGRADLLQVLWCPFDHPPKPHPSTAVFWRSAAEVTNILTAPPEPAAVQYEFYVPEPCLLDPEQVTEYPNPMELSTDLQHLLGQWSTWQEAGAAPDSYYEPAPQEFYRNELSLAPGWKVGGWTRWGLTDPLPQFCPACDTEMTPLVTIASTEWDDNTRAGSRTRTKPMPHCPPPTPTRKPTKVVVASGYNLQLYACPASPDHPHTELVQ